MKIWHFYLSYYRQYEDGFLIPPYRSDVFIFIKLNELTFWCRLKVHINKADVAMQLLIAASLASTSREEEKLWWPQNTKGPIQSLCLVHLLVHSQKPDGAWWTLWKRTCRVYRYKNLIPDENMIMNIYPFLTYSANSAL